MPAKSPPNATPRALAVAEPGVASQDSELAAAGRQLAEDMGTSGADVFSSPAERRAAERTARRRERAKADHTPAPSGRRSAQSTRAPALAWGSMFRDSLPAPLIALIAGGLIGLVLGALSIAGWVIGLLVAGLTVVLFRALGSSSRSTRSAAK